MNKDTAKDYLPLVQALAYGKTIEIKRSSGWHEIKCIDTLEIPPSMLRIKPEPSQESLDMASYLEEMANSIRQMKIQPHDITNTVSASGCGSIYNVTFIYSVRT